MGREGTQASVDGAGPVVPGCLPLARRSLPEAGGQLQWKPNERVWEFPAAAAAPLAAAVEERLGLEVQQPPKFVMKLFAERTEGAKRDS